MRINDFFGLLENSEISQNFFIDEIVRTKVAQKFIQLGDKKILNNEKKYQDFLKTTYDLGLAKTQIDRVLFDKLYEISLKFSLIELIKFWNKKYKNNYNLVFTDFLNSIQFDKKTVLIKNAIKQIEFLDKFIKNNKTKIIILEAKDNISRIILDFISYKYKNVKIDTSLKINKIDNVFSIPDFFDKQKAFEDIEGENEVLSVFENDFFVLLPAAFVFSSEFKKARNEIAENFNIEKIFVFADKNIIQNNTVKIYGFLFSKNKKNKEVKIVELKNKNTKGNNGTLIVEKEIIKSRDEVFLSEKWEVNFLKNKNETVCLEDTAEIFRGIFAPKSQTGTVSYVNVSDLDDLTVDTKNCPKIKLNEKLLKKYRLEENDILLTIRGSKIKASIFKNSKSVAVASNNIVVIRVNTGEISGEFVMTLFRINQGRSLLSQFQRGAHFINLNANDIKKLNIPILPLNEQKLTVDTYKKNFQMLFEAQKKFDKAIEALDKFIEK